jgi:hypothetical protein
MTASSTATWQSTGAGCLGRSCNTRSRVVTPAALIAPPSPADP